MSQQLIFHGLKNPVWGYGLLLVVLLVIGLMIWLYRLERQYVSRPVGYTLVCLRGLVAIIILLMLWEPMLVSSNSISQQQQILVGLDLSGSMFAVDDHALPAEKLRWARALGLIGNSKTNSQIDRWIEAYENGQEPEWVSVDEQITDAEKKANLTSVRKQLVEETLAKLSGRTRVDLTLSTLLNPTNNLLDQLQDKGEVSVLGFAQRKQELNQLEDELKTEVLKKLSIQLGSDLSDLSLPLIHQPGSKNTASTTTAEEGASNAEKQDSTASSTPQNLAGIVLFSDGRDTLGEKALEYANRLKQLNIPVYTVLVGSQKRPLDLTITSLDFPLSVYKGDKSLIKVLLSTAGLEGQLVTVKLLNQLGKEIDQKQVLVTTANTEVDFEIQHQELGRLQYKFEVSTLADEIRTDNNSREFSLTVTDDSAHVLLVDGEGRWEFRYLEGALSRDPRVSLRSVLFRQPFIGLLSQPFFDRKLQPTTKEINQNPSASISPFSEQHLVILGDISPTHFTNQDWENLEKYVSESGGTLLIQAGQRFMPFGHNHEIFKRLLPIDDYQPLDIKGALGRKSPEERGFHLKLSPEAKAQAMFQFDVDEKRNAEIWSKLPGHNWGVAGHPKPGATVYANIELPDELKLIVPEDKQAVIVQQTYGFGQVIWMGIDSTWRWRYRVGDQYHHRFWGQLSRFAADNKFAAGNQFVRFGPEKPNIVLGEDAMIRARWTAEFMRQHPGIKSQIEIFKSPNINPATDVPFATMELQSLDTTPLIQEARIPGLDVGQYLIRLKPDSSIKELQSIEAELVVNPPKTVEMADISTNRVLLQQIAETSGGKFFRLDEANTIPSYIQGIDKTRETREEHALWDHWSVLCLLCSLLGIEWVLRKWNGLA